MEKVYIINMKDKFHIGDPELTVVAKSLKAAFNYLKLQGYEEIENLEYEKYDIVRDTTLIAWITEVGLID